MSAEDEDGISAEISQYSEQVRKLLKNLNLYYKH